MSARAQRRGAARQAPPRSIGILSNGDSIFAEDPHRSAPEARILWHAGVDPETLRVWAERGPTGSNDVIDPATLLPWLTIVSAPSAIEHAVLSDGWRRIRLDIERGSLATGRPVLLRFLIEGTRSAETKIAPLRRLLHLCRHGHFASSLYPRDERADRRLVVLRVHDALEAGATHRDIGRVLFGRNRIEQDWNGQSDSLRSRVRRLAAEARFMAAGGFRSLLMHRAGR